MSLEAGARLGPYEIVAVLASSEKSAVYKATDTTLNRTVALRTLPANAADAQDRKARLEQEAQVIAALSHPNICTPHDVAHDDALAVDFVVTEYVEGQTLAKRLERGALPLRDAVKIAIDVADALDKAHQKGLVHRSLRPSNIMLTDNGAKLLDFGLSQTASEAENAKPSVSMRTTKSHALAADIPDHALRYMAPEQIDGGAIDARADIFAFGAIFHEMVTGARAFEGKNRPMLIAAIASLDLDPLSKSKPAVPPALDHVAARCVEKDPDDRWQTAHDLTRQLRWIAGGGALLPAAGRVGERRLLFVAAALALLAMGTAAPALMYFRAPASDATLQFRVPVYGLSQSDVAISPNGEAIALVARPDPPEAASLYVRPVGATTFRRVAGTDEAALPFWSPDSKSIGFVAGGQLKKVDAAGGPPQNISEAPGFAGGAWNASGTILFGSPKGIFRVSAQGGKPEALTMLDKAETGHYWPSFLPDGRHFLYLGWSADAGSRAVFVATLDSKEKKRVMTAESNAAYAAPGFVVYHREATLFAQAWDSKSLALTGEPLHIADELAFNATNGRGSFDASQNGALLYFQGQGGTGASGRASVAAIAQFGWRSRTGAQLAIAGDSGPLGDMDLSPDGNLIAVTRQDPGAPGADIWVIDWQRGAATRLTLDPADDMNPVWSPDGLRVAFTTYRKGNADIYVKNANGVGAETPLLETPANEIVEDWSKDGRYLAYKLGRDTAEDIYALPLFGDRKPIPVVQGAFRKDEAQFSYDGKWIAYTSDESGTFQVYVIAFPSGSERHQVSTNGGGQPRWRKDGRELFYKTMDGNAMAVDMTLGARVESGIPHRLFGQGLSTIDRDPVRHQWSVTPDGQRFLVRIAPGAGAAGRGNNAGIPFNFTASAGGAAGRGTPRGSGGGTSNINNLPPSGLTVVRHWAALLKPKS